MAMRVNEGVFFFLGLYSGSDTSEDFFLGLLSSSGVIISGIVKITVFSFWFTSFMLQPMLCQLLA